VVGLAIFIDQPPLARRAIQPSSITDIEHTADATCEAIVRFAPPSTGALGVLQDASQDLPT